MVGLVAVAESVTILTGLRERYEAHHRVSITDQAIVAAANMADRYISDRHLPDKAIDLIDEAGSRLRIRRMQAPPDYKELEDEIASVRNEKEAAIEAQQFERAAKLRDREKELLEQRSSKEQEWRAEGVDLFNEVNEESIADSLSLRTFAIFSSNSRRSGGAVIRRIRIRAPASSIRSIALSGRNRSLMYRSASVAAPTRAASVIETRWCAS